MEHLAEGPLGGNVSELGVPAKGFCWSSASVSLFESICIFVGMFVEKDTELIQIVLNHYGQTQNAACLALSFFQPHPDVVVSVLLDKVFPGSIFKVLRQGM